MRSKYISYLGLATRSRKLVSGENTCEAYLKKNQVKLLIIAEDCAENTKNKFSRIAESNDIKYFINGSKEEISNAIGQYNRSVIAILDLNWANVIELELMNRSSN